MINERYELDRPIGRGSMGVVYRATRLAAPGGVVAIKRVPVASDPMLRERLRAEAEVLALLDHPHIVRVHEVIDDGDGLAVVMPLATGGSLADRLVREGRMDATVVASFAAEIGDALSCAHRQGVLHCDVKPSNILFTSEGDALLTDFGLARWVSRPSVWGGAVMGTAEYLDPEVADGLQPDSRSDVYSLAVVCYEALTGRVPFTGPTALAVLKRAERGRATAVANLVPDLPVGLSEAVAAGMARKRSRRPESAQALAAALRSSGTLAQPRARPCEAGPGTSAPPAAEMGCSSGPPTARFDFRPLGPHDPGEEPRADARARRSPARPALVALAAVTACIVGLAVLAGEPWGWRRPTEARTARRPAGRGRASPPGLSRSPRSTCAPVPAAGGQIVIGDVRGDGCPLRVSWQDNVATVALDGGGPPARFSLGRPGDVLLLGDWSCQGRAVPGLYRPPTGEVYLFSGWAPEGAPLSSAMVQRTGVTDGTASVVRGGAGYCDRVEVRPDSKPVGGHLDAAGKETP